MPFKYQPPWQGPLSGRSFEKQTEDFLNGIESRVDEIDTRQTPSDATPMPPGVGSAGTSGEYSRGDHSHPLQSSVSGNAGSADELSVARQISMANEGSGSAFFNGSADISIPLRVGCTASETTERRYIADRFADYVNVRDFGAKGDGVTDDTSAVQAALDKGGFVFMPAGTYKVSKLYIKSNTFLSGAGVDSTVILATLGTRTDNALLNEHAYIRLSNGVTSSNQIFDENIQIQDLTINLDYFNRFTYQPVSGGETYGCGISFGAVKNATCRNVLIVNPGLHGFNTQGFSNQVGRTDLSSYDTVDPAGAEPNVAVGRSANIVFDNCHVRGCFLDDAFTTHMTDYCTINNCTIKYEYADTLYGKSAYQSQCGVEFDACCRHCAAYNSQAYGMGRGFSVVSHTNEVPTQDVLFENCVAVNCGVSFGTWKGFDTEDADFLETTGKNRGLTIIDCISRSLMRARKAYNSDELYGANFLSVSNAEQTKVLNFTAEGAGDVGSLVFGAAVGVELSGVYLEKSINTGTGNSREYGRFRILSNSASLVFSNITIDDETTNSSLIEITNNGLVAIDNVRFLSAPSNTFYLINGVLNSATARFAGIISGCSLSSWVVKHYVSGSSVVDTYTRNAVGDVACFSSLATLNSNIIAGAGVYPATNGSGTCGKSNAKWGGMYTVQLGSANNPVENAYSSTGQWTGSDFRLKTDVQEPDEAVFRAWGKVRFVFFKLVKSVESKGADSARIHAGVIAQEVKAAFESEGLDAGRYGLFCHDSWGDAYDEGGALIEAAGDVYGIRYEEALALECAYQRWLGEKRDARIAQLEAARL